jgi:hypothetical protein
MTKKRPEFVASWSARKEDLESGSAKILRTLTELRDCFAELSKWCCQAPPFVPIPFTAHSIAEVVTKSRDKSALPESGWSFSAWTEPHDRPFGLVMFFGATSRWVDNRITLSFPPEVVPSPTGVKCVLSIFIRIWEPLWAAYNPVPRKDEKRFELGEQTFLSSEAGDFLGDISNQGIAREPMSIGQLYTLNPSEIERLYLLAAHFGPKDRSAKTATTDTVGGSTQ